MAQKRRKNKKSKKLLSIVLFLVLFVAAGIVAYLVWDGYFKEEKKEDESSEVEEVEEAVEGEEGGKGAAGEEVIEKEPIVQYEGDNPNEAEELTGVVTYAAVNGDNLMIRVNIDQYLDSGNCELSLIQGGVKYSNTANISSVTTATCEGFNVPVSELGSGNYQIIIKLSSDGKTGTIKGEVNI